MGAKYPPARAPRFTVTIGGQTFPEYDYVSDLVVDTTTDGADYFALTLTHPFDHEQGSFTDLKWSQFEPGKDVTIQAGYGEGNDANTKIFTGFIENVRTEFPPHEPPSITLSGYSPLRKLMRGTNSSSWKNKSIGAIVKARASPHLKQVKTKGANRKLDRVFQDGETDYQFIKSLARKYGFEFFSTLGEAHFRPQTGGKSPGNPVADLYYGESLESFTAEESTPPHGAVQVRYWNEKKQSEIVATAKNSKGSEKQVYRIPVESKAEAQDIADAKLKSRKVEGTAETFGIPSITAGSVIKCAGVGKKFTGKYYVTDATHRIGESGYRMSMEITQLN